MSAPRWRGASVHPLPASPAPELPWQECVSCGRQSPTLYVSHTTGICVHCEQEKAQR